MSTTTLADEALEALTSQGERVSLRYALQLLAPAAILARCRGSTTVAAEDIEESVDLFWDAGRSAGAFKDNSGFSGFIS